MSYTFDDLKLYLPYNGGDRFFEEVVKLAQAQPRKSISGGELTLREICQLIIDEALERAADAKEMEESLEFDDEIVSITPLGDQELMDITVTRDNLFYANGVLTKNSLGIPATLDGMWAFIRTEELDKIGQLMVLELKTRYGNKSIPKFTIGVNIDTQRLFNAEEQESRSMTTITTKTEVKRTPVNTFTDASSKRRFADFKMSEEDE